MLTKVDNLFVKLPGDGLTIGTLMSFFVAGALNKMMDPTSVGQSLKFSMQNLATPYSTSKILIFLLGIYELITSIIVIKDSIDNRNTGEKATRAIKLLIVVTFLSVAYLLFQKLFMKAIIRISMIGSLFIVLKIFRERTNFMKKLEELKTD